MSDTPRNLDDARALAVVCHGLGANRAAFFGLAELAWQLDCETLAFDFRAHGESEGRVCTMSAREVEDVLAAVRFLRASQNRRIRGTRSRVPSRIGGALRREHSFA